MKDFDDSQQIPDIEDLEDAYEVITMTGDEGEDVDFIIIDTAKYGENTYLLVVESQDIEEEESEALILKELYDKGEDVFYQPVTDDNEFENVAALFKNTGTDYEIEF